MAKQGAKLMASGYVSETKSQPPKITAAAINCNRSFEGLTEKIKDRYKGNFLREARRASGFHCGPFTPRAFSSQIERINKSLPIRCGRPMRPAYLRSASELQASFGSSEHDGCRDHWSVWWGVSGPEGPDDLVGYIKLNRYGELAIYSVILGHGDFLGRGIMPHLHLGVMRFILDMDDGIKWLMYAGWNDGGRGLQLWKKKAGFDPVMFFNK
jgi:hypothetical protein